MVEPITKLNKFFIKKNSYERNAINPLNFKTPNKIPKIKLMHTLNQKILSNLLFFVVSSVNFSFGDSDIYSNN